MVTVSLEYQEIAVNEAVQSDFVLVGMVIFACLIYMCLHMGSLFLGIVSLVNITMTVPICICIYKYIFQI